MTDMASDLERTTGFEPATPTLARLALLMASPAQSCRGMQRPARLPTRRNASFLVVTRSSAGRMRDADPAKSVAASAAPCPRVLASDPHGLTRRERPSRR